ncbi:SDR family NAD(P)-dependent oxidoreductase [soil metagenome]
MLVSGGAGFIGSHLVERLLARGDRVTVVDNLSTGRRANLPARHEGLRFLNAELARELDVFEPDEMFDEVYHLAAAVGVKLVIDDPIGSIETNVAQTSALLRFVRERCPAARVLIASSSEVYGKSERVPFREDDDVVYGPTTKSRWSYAASKAIDEYLALAHAQTHGMAVVVARFFNTVGPRQVGEYGMVLPRFVGAALANQPLHVHGDGEQTRCFCDVRDVADLLPRVLATPAAYGRVFNVGSDESITIAALARLVIETLQSGSRVQFIPYDRAYEHGFEDLRRREPDLARLRSVVGFTPTRALRTTIRDLAAQMQGLTAAVTEGAL